MSNDYAEQATDEQIALREQQMVDYPGEDIQGVDRWEWERQLIARIRNSEFERDQWRNKLIEILGNAI